jgi:hypothetical protein
LPSLGYAKAKEMVAGSQLVTVYDRIYHDMLMSMAQLLPSRMQVGITLSRSKDAFVLLSDDEASNDYKIEIVSVSLFVKRVYLNPTATALVNQSLANGGRLYYQRLHMTALPCAKGTRSWNWHNCFSGVAPRRVFVALASQEGYYGSFGRVGNFLETAGVSTVRFSLDGRDIMAEPYRVTYVYKEDGSVDEDATDVKSALHGFTATIGTFFAPRDHVGLSLSEYLRGGTIYCVDLEHADAMGPVPGSLSVHIGFERELDESMVVLVMGEYPKTIAFDANRAISEL